MRVRTGRHRQAVCLRVDFRQIVIDIQIAEIDDFHGVDAAWKQMHASGVTRPTERMRVNDERPFVPHQRKIFPHRQLSAFGMFQQPFFVKTVCEKFSPVSGRLEAEKHLQADFIAARLGRLVARHRHGDLLLPWRGAVRPRVAVDEMIRHDDARIAFRGVGLRCFGSRPFCAFAAFSRMDMRIK